MRLPSPSATCIIADSAPWSKPRRLRPRCSDAGPEARPAGASTSRPSRD